MSKKLRIGCLLCAIYVLFACTLSGCAELDTDNGTDDRDSGYVDNSTNHDNKNMQNNSDFNVKSVPIISSVMDALQTKDYFVMDIDTEGADMDSCPSGVEEWYVYFATRFYDEYGNRHPFNRSESVESLMNSDDYIWLEEVRIWYLRFDSVASAQNEYNKYYEAFNNYAEEGSSSTDSGTNWQQFQKEVPAKAANVLVSRTENVLIMIYADWDDFDDAGIAYDNAAIKAIEQIGF